MKKCKSRLFFPNQSFISLSVNLCEKCDLSHLPAPHLTSTWQGPTPPRTQHTAPDPKDKSSSRVWRWRTQEKVTVSAASACIPSAPSSVAPVSLSVAPCLLLPLEVAKQLRCMKTFFLCPLLTILTILTSRSADKCLSRDIARAAQCAMDQLLCIIVQVKIGRFGGGILPMC